MATKLSVFANSTFRNGVSTMLWSNSTVQIAQTRNLSNSLIGTIPPEPLKRKFSVPKVLVCISVGVYIGQYMAKSFATFMEETELFVPDDDDD